MSNVPKLNHGKQVEELRDQLVVYKHQNPGVIEYLSAGSDAKLMIASSDSERHPDLLIYCSPAPEMQDPWWDWIPEIVIEVVSDSSRKRDYEDKPEEYLEFGVREYWIIDAANNQMTAHQRRGGQWKPQIVKPSKKYSTRILPSFTLDLKRVISVGSTKPRSSK